MLREFSLIHSSSFQESGALSRLTKNRSSNTWKHSLPMVKSTSLYEQKTDDSSANVNVLFYLIALQDLF